MFLSVGDEPASEEVQATGAKRSRKSAKDSAAIESSVAAHTAKVAKTRTVSRNESNESMRLGLEYLDNQAEKVRKGNEKAAADKIAQQMKAQRLAEAEARNLKRQRKDIRKANEKLLKQIEANDARTSNLADRQQAVEDERRRIEEELKKGGTDDAILARRCRERGDERLALELQREEEEAATVRTANKRTKPAGRPVRFEDIGFKLPNRKTPQLESSDQEVFTSAQVAELLSDALERQEA